MEKSNGCNFEWFIKPPNDEAEEIKWKGLIPPPRAVSRNNEHTFEGNSMIETDTDVQDLFYPSNIKKLDSNTNSSNIKRKNLVRSKI